MKKRYLEQPCTRDWKRAYRIYYKSSNFRTLHVAVSITGCLPSPSHLVGVDCYSLPMIFLITGFIIRHIICAGSGLRM